MIKIIKKGTRQIATCEKCGCVFSYEEEDIKHLGSCKKYVICPQCNTDVVVSQTRGILEESEGE